MSTCAPEHMHISPPGPTMRRLVATSPWGTATEPDWRRAACRGHDTEAFFPIYEDHLAPEVRALCAGCPIRGGCLEWALATGEVYGYWGGMSERERRAERLRRLNPHAPAPVPAPAPAPAPAAAAALAPERPAVARPRIGPGRARTIAALIQFRPPSRQPYSNAEIAGMTGVSPHTVARYRAAGGIPPSTRRRFTQDAVLAHLLRTHPDYTAAQIAHLAGVSAATVCRYRQRKEEAA